MSKKLIAGLGTVAALGVAALPLAGVFAVDDTAETIVRVNVLESVQCQSAGTSADFVWFGDVAIGVDASQNFTVTGSTNSENGFSIIGTAYDLNSGTLDVANNVRGEWADFHADTTDANAIEYNRATAGDGKWWLSGGTGVTIATDANTITLAPTAAVGEQSYSLTANVRPDYTNKPGIYQGRIVWACTVND